MEKRRPLSEWSLTHPKVKFCLTEIAFREAVGYSSITVHVKLNQQNEWKEENIEAFTI